MTYRPLVTRNGHDVVLDAVLSARCKHGYYGGFPAGSLEKLRLPLGALIDDMILFVCSGMVRKYPYRGFGPNDKTVDIKRIATVKGKGGQTRRIYLNPDYVMDVRHELPQSPDDPRGWRAMIVDTPYSREEAKNYGTANQYPEPGPLLKRCLEHTRPGGRVGFLHWEWPGAPSKVDGCDVKEVHGALVTTGRRSTARHYVVFEKVAQPAHHPSLITHHSRGARS